MWECPDAKKAIAKRNPPVAKPKASQTNVSLDGAHARPVRPLPSRTRVTPSLPTNTVSANPRPNKQARPQDWMEDDDSAMATGSGSAHGTAGHYVPQKHPYVGGPLDQIVEADEEAEADDPGFPEAELDPNTGWHHWPPPRQPTLPLRRVSMPIPAVRQQQPRPGPSTLAYGSIWDYSGYADGSQYQPVHSSAPWPMQQHTPQQPSVRGSYFAHDYHIPNYHNAPPPFGSESQPVAGPSRL